MSSPDPRAHDRSDVEYGTRPNRHHKIHEHIKGPEKRSKMKGPSALIAMAKALKKKM